ncbi:MAG: DUF4054 domain-containing protein [Oscillospiraceae bacterium]|nr:DUF4054 domain-containing protein [Oscillospiraceae bacterium]
MTIEETVRMIAPEFKETDPETLGRWTELVSPLVSRKAFGKSYNLALALLCCHKMKMNGLGYDSETGSIADMIAVSSYSEGSTSIGFSTSQANNLLSDAELALTVYGVQYLQLRKSMVIGITVSS